MALFKRGGWSVGSLTIPCLMVLFLVAYFFGNLGMHIFRSPEDANDKTVVVKDFHNAFPIWLGLSDAEAEEEYNIQKHCDSIEAYVEDGRHEDPALDTNNAWMQMKWGLPPAKCRVNGLLIERLDPLNNYRRGVALGFTTDLDDKTHIEHWFLGTKLDLNKRKRRVFIDLGANYFTTSLLWFLQRYPCDFTEVHAFEIDTSMLRLPEGFDESSNWVPPNNVGWKKLSGREGYIPKWMVKRIKTYNKFVGDVDDESRNLLNITRFIKDELKLTKDDTVIVKMDIEGSEWPILERWVKDPDMPKIIDELWVELHYYHPDNNWETVKQYTREHATRMLAELRFRGFYAHYWD